MRLRLRLRTSSLLLGALVASAALVLIACGSFSGAQSTPSNDGGVVVADASQTTADATSATDASAAIDSGVVVSDSFDDLLPGCGPNWFGASVSLTPVDAGCYRGAGCCRVCAVSEVVVPQMSTTGAITPGAYVSQAYMRIEDGGLNAGMAVTSMTWDVDMTATNDFAAGTAPVGDAWTIVRASGSPDAGEDRVTAFFYRQSAQVGDCILVDEALVSRTVN